MIVLYKQGIQLTPTLCIAGNGAARLESESACENVMDCSCLYIVLVITNYFLVHFTFLKSVLFQRVHLKELLTDP